MEVRRRDDPEFGIDDAGSAHPDTEYGNGRGVEELFDQGDSCGDTFVAGRALYRFDFNDVA